MSVRVSTSPGGCLVGLGILAFAAVMTTIIVTVGIWPGEAKLVAPILCPDDRPDPFVVADSHQVSPGETSYNFTLYCMGPRGEHTDVGFFRPMLLLTVLHAVIVATLITLVTVVIVVRHRRRDGPTPTAPAEPAGGPVTT